MSTTSAPVIKMTASGFRNRKNQEKIVMLTAYSAPVAKLLAPHVDALLIGDSLGMVLYGLPSTLPVTMEMMINHTLAVRRGAPDAFIITDLPFASYQTSKEQAFDSAAILLKNAGTDAVKLEGGTEMAETVRFLTSRGIPVMGHTGLMPQRIQQLGSYRAQGRDSKSAAQIMDDTKAIADAGAFGIVLEGILKTLASDITKTISVPTIGIGASPDCDGQVLVTDDLLGIFSDFTPKFVRKYANLSAEISKAAENYAKDVKGGQFPADKECFN